jgi:probable F420-dependent oxidoreductase
MLRGMKADCFAYVSTAKGTDALAQGAKDLGYDAWWAPETQADAFNSCTVAATAGTGLEIGTGIAVAFARNPMTVAVQANDLQILTGGKFMLGLGSQIKPHITKRFSMPWSHPAARMREFILAIRAIWRAWETSEPLSFEGEFYSHTLMTPFFDPGPNPHGNPKIILAAVGPLMNEVAGEVADGVMCHGLCTERYLREVMLPALQRGAEKAGRSLDGFEINVPGFLVMRDGEEELAEGIEFVRKQIGFYGSTPAYKGVFELEGWMDLQPALRDLTKRGAWDELPNLVSDEVLDTLTIYGKPEDVATELKDRMGDICTRVGISVPEGATAERWRPVFEQLRDAA